VTTQVDIQEYIAAVTPGGMYLSLSIRKDIISISQIVYLEEKKKPLRQLVYIEQNLQFLMELENK
jgi:hypothetical protein